MMISSRDRNMSHEMLDSISLICKDSRTFESLQVRCVLAHGEKLNGERNTRFAKEREKKKCTAYVYDMEHHQRCCASP